MTLSPGARFRQALKDEVPLQIVGVLNPYGALMAEKAGFKALYLSGAGVSNISYGLPDIGLTSLENVLEDAKRITARTTLPLLVDIDTGFGDIESAIRSLEKKNVAAIHIEDQEDKKKCGHLEGKLLVSSEEMCKRIRTAVRARENTDFVIMARTDAKGGEALKRAEAYVKSGADMIFAEAVETLEEYKAFKSLNVPILANITEFGKTPLFDLSELKRVGVAMALYPLTIARLMNRAAWEGLQELKEKGTQKGLIRQMQTRKELYEFLSYKG